MKASLAMAAGTTRRSTSKQKVGDEMQHARLASIFSQLRVGTSVYTAKNIWDVVGDGQQHGALFRFSSTFDRSVVALLRVVALIDVIWVPLVLTFLRHRQNEEVAKSSWARGLDVVTGTIYAFGIACRLLTSSVDVSVGREYLEFKDICKQQAKRPTFWTDILSMPGNFWWLHPSWRSLAGLRLLRIWRLTTSAYRDYEVALGEPPGFTRSVVELLGSVWLSAHFFACTWFACITWPYARVQDIIFDNPDAPPLDDPLPYLTCLRSGVELLVGWSGPTPSSSSGVFSDPEELYCIISAPLSAVFMAAVYARLLVIVDRAEETYARYTERMDKIRSVLHSLGVPSELKNRVVQYHAFQSVHNIDKPAFEILFSGLSTNLHLELKLFLYEQLVLTAPFFQQVPPVVVATMVSAFELEVFSPGDMIIRKHEIGHEMYFIVKGSCDVLIDDHARVKAAEKRVGDYFGEVALVYDQARNAWVCANVFCLLAKLTRTAFNEAVRAAPWVKQIMVQNIQPNAELSTRRYPRSVGSGETSPLLQD